MGKKGEGGEEVPTASYKLNKLQDIMYTTGNRVNNIVKLCMGTDDYWIYRSDHRVRYINVDSLCCTPETNIVLHANYTKKQSVC